MRSIKILFVTYEPHPTFRPDVATLFGKYLPREGVASDVVTDTPTPSDLEPWGGGQALLAPTASGRLRRQLEKAKHGIATVARRAGHDYAAVQVRDLPITAAIALCIARWKKVPFIYWMSFPLPASQIIRARAIGPRAGLRYWFPLVQGWLGRFALDHVVLPRADHVFV